MAQLKKAPDVRLDTVEWRVDGNPIQVRGGWRARFIPYLNRAIVADLLDEWVGPANWEEKYETGHLNGKEVVWATVSIRDPETGEWVSRHDVGKPSNFEGEKGAVSDAFKRAASLGWGAGRNVYQLPTLWSEVDVKEKNGKNYVNTNERTIPEILRQLKQMGYEVEGARTGTAIADGGDDATPSQEASPFELEEVQVPTHEAPKAKPAPAPAPESYDEERETDIAKPATLQKLGAIWATIVQAGHQTEDELRSELHGKYGTPSRKLLTEAQAQAEFQLKRQELTQWSKQGRAS